MTDYTDTREGVSTLRGLAFTGVSDLQVGEQDHDGDFIDTKTGRVSSRRSGTTEDLHHRSALIALDDPGVHIRLAADRARVAQQLGDRFDRQHDVPL